MGVMKKIERKLSKNKTKQNKQMVIKQRPSTILNFSLCVSSTCDLDVFFPCMCVYVGMYLIDVIIMSLHLCSGLKNSPCKLERSIIGKTP